MKLKTFIASLAALAVFVSPAAARTKQMTSQPGALFKTATPITDAFIDANRVFSYVTNLGSFGRDLVGTFNLSGGGGVVYPFSDTADFDKGVNKTAIFAAGLWLGAIDSTPASPDIGDTLIAMAEFSEEFVPGTMTGDTSSLDNTGFRVYKLYSDSLASNPNADYLAWPVADGAPIDALGDPLMIGDQMLWSVFNDADPNAHTNNSGSTAPLGIVVEQTVFAFKREDPFGDMFFIRYKIMNKGSKSLEQMHISLWCDPDLGGFLDDLVGSDTILSLGYVFNETNSDDVYGSNPPAVGFDFFQGPLQFTGDMADTAIMWGQFIPMNVNLPLVSFNKYINGTDPTSLSETYQYMNGLDGKTGLPLVNPTTGLDTKFFGSGDPTTGTGWIDGSGADRRFMLNTGPISFAPGDSTEIIAAIVFGQGVDRLTSISAMKFFDKFAQTAYEKFFNLPKPPQSPIVTTIALENEIVLTWGTESETNPGDFAFEGYSIYQGETPVGPWKRITTFDVNNGVASIFDDQFDINLGVVVNLPVQFGTDGGIQNQISITQDAVVGGRLNNLTDYFFRVEAYSFDALETPKVLGASTVVTGTPQAQVAETDYPQTYGDTLTATHASGPSDGSVSPLVVNPGVLTGNTYMITFSDSTESGSNVTRWNLFNSTTGDTLLLRQLNQSGADTGYGLTDGLLVRVSGPPPGMKDWTIPSGTRRFTWAGADFGFEGFNGAIGWGSPTGVFGGFPEPVPATALKNVLLVLATADSLGNFDIVNDTNVSYAYRHGRNFSAPPALPSFAPFIINTAGTGYDYQDFTKSVPLSAWNMDATPPQRLAVGFLENNQPGGLVDGKWFPGDFNFYDNVAGSGPREWLWIYDAPYTTTPDPTFEVEIIFNPTPVMWWLTVNRRGDVPFSTVADGGTGIDQFEIIPNRVNSPADTFTFSAPAPTVAASPTTEDLSDIKAVPNPYYLFSGYENDQFLRDLRFSNLPTECTIRIFNLSGDLVRTIDKNSSESFITWNTLTERGLPVGSGIYIYLVSTPGGAEKIGKLAIFTETEQLTNF